MTPPRRGQGAGAASSLGLQGGGVVARGSGRNGSLFPGGGRRRISAGRSSLPEIESLNSRIPLPSERPTLVAVKPEDEQHDEEDEQQLPQWDPERHAQRVAPRQAGKVSHWRTKRSKKTRSGKGI